MKLEYKIFSTGFDSIEDIINEIKALPTYQLQGKESYFVNVKEVGKILANHVEVQLIRYGEWNYCFTHQNGERRYSCSECNELSNAEYKYCPHCGAKMKEKINYCKQCQHWKNSDMPCQWDYMYNNKDYYYDCTDFIRKEDNND